MRQFTSRSIPSWKVDRLQKKYLDRFYCMTLEERKEEIKTNSYYKTLYEMRQLNLYAPQTNQFKRHDSNI